MGTKMTRGSRTELARTVRKRYLSATNKQKQTILKEFIAATGYHPKSAVRVLNAPAEARTSKTRHRRPLYDEAARTALIILWEASDRVCSKRLRALLPVLLPALERHGHLRLNDVVRRAVLAMSAATIDRLLRPARKVAKPSRPRRIVPEPRRKVRVRTFTDWNDPVPGSMEMDLVAHCGDVNRGSYVHSLVLTDIASGWIECAPLVVRDGALVVEGVERIRAVLPFTLKALDTDNGSEFINETLIKYCMRHGIELTRSRPYRKNDQAWVEQKNGSVVRKLLGYRRYQGVAAAQALARLYGVARLFVNFFQPSFKLAEKHRQGAHVTKRYGVPQTPCQRLLDAESTPETVKQRLRDTAEGVDPLKLLEEIRALQSHLVALSDKVPTPADVPTAVDMATFMSSLSDAWRDGEVRPTHRSEANSTRYQRVVKVTPSMPRKRSPAPVLSAAIDPQELKRSAAELGWPSHDPEIERKCALRQKEYARRHIQRQHAFTLVWPLVCRRLEGSPNISARGLFDELRAMYPGRWHRGQLAAFTQRVSQWRRDAHARGIEIGPIKHRRSLIPRGRRRPDPFAEHWTEILALMDEDPDQTARELIDAVIARFPSKYTIAHLRTLQRRLKVWRRDSVQRLILEMEGEAFFAESNTAGNNLNEATGNKVR
jgi:Integrase core domain